MAPPTLRVSATALDIAPDEDVAAVLVTNAGGGAFSFEVRVEAQAGGVSWMSVDPGGGLVAAGSERPLLVRVQRANLGPGRYEGQLIVRTDGAGAETVAVGMEVGRPVLSVEPASLDYGDVAVSRYLVVENVGTGLLRYAVSLPAGWIRCGADASGELPAEAPKTIELTVDRSQAPWYGEGASVVVVSSNGQDDETHSSVAVVPVSLLVDDGCDGDWDCAGRWGTYCRASEAGEGHCAARRQDGELCSERRECVSGHCVGGVCCDGACDQQCRSCAEPGQAGRCVPRPEGTGCEDGLRCTQGDGCREGTCVGGAQRDCSWLDWGDCVEGLCEEEAGGCVPVLAPERCLIEGRCHASGEEQAGSLGCARCDPATATQVWSPLRDGSGCDDQDPCTVRDRCEAGACTGSPKDCGDAYDCTEDWCTPGTGACGHRIVPRWCLIDGRCVPSETGPPGLDAQCRICDPVTAAEAWTFHREGLVCDDASECSEESGCVQGVCRALGPLCDDHNPCSEDVCSEGLLCSHLPTNEGGRCDDGLLCTVDDACVEGACQGKARECDGGDECTLARCSEQDAGCTIVRLDEGHPCRDEDPCTVRDSCTPGGVCHGEPRDCSHVLGPDDRCLDSYCDPDTEPEPGGCRVRPKVDGTPCDDGAYCSVEESCQGGECVGQVRHCMPAPCQRAVCDEEHGECGLEPDPEQTGTACASRQICVVGSVCQPDGSCAAGHPKSEEQCSLELGNTNDCLVGVCVDPHGCTLSEAPEGTPCGLPNALEARCHHGTCELERCAEGFGDCRQDDPGDGCETRLSDNPESCGACGQVCEAAHCARSCEQGRCVLLGCEVGYADCDGLPETGCEVHIGAEANHCGGCNQPCRDEGRFANADVECVAGDCLFVRCRPGFEDDNGDCAQGGRCLDGCEACQPLVDGGVEIPDDGEDNNCDGVDAVNDEQRGYYVDPSFAFGGQCPEPGRGTRGCPFGDLDEALWEAQHVQSWDVAELARRELYLAGGHYVADGVVADLSRPLALLGGYRRIAAGPWARDVAENETVLRSRTGLAVSVAADAQGWGVLDGLAVTPRINVIGRLIARRVRSFGPLDVAADAYGASLWLEQSEIQGDVDDSFGSDGWTIRDVVIHGSVTGRDDWVLANSSVDGDVGGGDGWSLIDSTISGEVRVRAGWTVTSSSIAGRFGGSSSHVLRGNTLHGEVSGGSEWTFVGNHMTGRVLRGHRGWAVVGNTIESIVIGGDDWTLSDNRISGEVWGDSGWLVVGNTISGEVRANHDWTLTGNRIEGSVRVTDSTCYTLTGNTVYVPRGEQTAAMALWSPGGRITNNAFIWQGDLGGAFQALREADDSADLVVLRNNAFIGFAGLDAALYLDEAASPIADIDALNAFDELPECGRGGNIVIDDIRDAGFVSLDPSSAGFLMLRPDSLLVDAGLDLPLTCLDDVIDAPTSDRTGQRVPCGAGPDIGCHERCEEQQP